MAGYGSCRERGGKTELFLLNDALPFFVELKSEEGGQVQGSNQSPSKETDAETMNSNTGSETTEK